MRLLLDLALVRMRSDGKRGRIRSLLEIVAGCNVASCAPKATNQ
jgi:hypothetical protein